MKERKKENAKSPSRVQKEKQQKRSNKREKENARTPTRIQERINKEKCTGKGRQIIP